MLRTKLGQTAIFSGFVLICALAVDFVVNVVIAPGVTPYTPLITALIALTIAPPFCYYLISQRMKMQAARDELAVMLKARDAAEAQSAAKTAFLARMSHELRTPLNAIIGFSEMMQETAKSDARMDDVADHGRVLGAAANLLGLIDRVLDYATLEAGRASCAIGAFDARVLVEEAMSLARPMAIAQGNTLRADIAPDLGGGVSDAQKIRQCLLSLVSNAVKFTKAGDVRVLARRENRSDGDWLVFEVHDTGIGIAPEHIEALFGAFEQADPSLTRLFDGAGIGLALTRRTATLLGGAVNVTSAPGKGSVFTLSVPAIYAANQSEQAARAAA